MKKFHWTLFLGLSLVFNLLPNDGFSQGGFFDSSPSLEEPDGGDKNSESDTLPDEKDSLSQKSPQEDDSPVVLLDRVKIRVNNIILTQRQFSIFYALRKLSPSLSKLPDEESVTKELSRIMGLEAFAKMNNLYSLLPTRNEMDTRVNFFTANLQVETLLQAATKIDPSGSLTPSDLRKFFYYQILREKGFVFALQKDFMGKIFTPREDEILLLYKQIVTGEPKAFQTPIQLYIRNIAIVEPANQNQKKNLIQSLQNTKRQIDRAPDFEQKKKQFIGAIRQYSSSHLKNIDVIGPLDEELVNRDFPEYKGLFVLKKGGTSKVIDQDGFIRLVFVDSKEEGTMKSIDSPDIRQRLTGILYNMKGESLFEDFMQNNLSNLDVQIIGDADAK